MDFEFLKMCIQLFIALGITLGIIFLSYKILGTKVESINNNKYVKVIERTQITKDNAILVVKVGKKGYVMTCSGSSMESLSELSQEEINEIEDNKKRYNKEIMDGYNKVVSASKNNVSKVLKNIRSKEEKHEK
ncbi:flagellar biosynthetic protein FliO [Clostridium butyricum]|uniref:flagellar biosynthetic protein FliO n=1 Tax=Clostridium butyricum TaxID=1492 RepID=UPI0013D27EC1|nr:flagellar biosynthetic protein FliO [Clostridium butyricum]MCQ2022208.1 flagellar biosynthetic protein FliO [Clostridium butyricum]NFB70061.1 flagellar formation protein [Clostridium butyricum]NFB89848.1 flagellar formation protein [Clostridium butyricum]